MHKDNERGVCPIHTRNTTEKENTMRKELYFIEAPGVMGGELKKLTERQAEELRKQGYTVSK